MEWIGWVPWLLGGLTLLLPALVVALCALYNAGSFTLRLLVSLLAAELVALAFSSGMWIYTSQHLRYVLLAAFGVALLRFWTRPYPAGAPVGGRAALALGVAMGAGLWLVAAAANWRGPVGEGIELDFPLRGGRYCVSQGGRSPVTNFVHRFLEARPHALDIVRLNRWGNRADGLQPSELLDYEIFGDAVYSPCDGRVVAAVDGIPDKAPGRLDRSHRLGNHVAIDCGGATVVLAQLRAGSVEAAVGHGALRGERIGRVGNSGYSTEPHLHIEAVAHGAAGGRSVPMRFGERALAMNSIVEVGGLP